MSRNKATAQRYIEGLDREIENDAFTGRPAIKITRMVEENDVVNLKEQPTPTPSSPSYSPGTAD